ncbi:hypothetical protein [Pseudoxanthomonas sp. JBR18]|uniref:hypothetical protein n=1 Tax=Pseudoxanthomonas sp. JBR18 TaxID=2969308 RepID=UPI0023062202|nr:hypothetical protein [Pseudoxanthomonas sp. JBR18]WCE05993.1 hypothetical protein PJ250_08615 [Pseudoxanthomonas sp. JBR18]
MSLTEPSTRRMPRTAAATLAAPRGPETRLATSARSSRAKAGLAGRLPGSPALAEAVAAFGRALDARLPLVESDEAWWAALTPVHVALASRVPPCEAGRFELEVDTMLARRGSPGWAVRQMMAKLGR